ncbi:serine/threonine protein kinase [Paenibacillus darwinianus]|uniref:Serine/threonine protein kinase n=1 Tax=Paenibacillus darwinianus TaxID=1380763 RepID=A0A9W5S1K2_9BACL|nr:serine/threonine-protein kinase [Paenibacillus darwinianus]EXX89894.1 serine/threonine protein kinase [Paenibacillus darwinianus]EXX90342.1 serine/threonine protein kinase [Paenibacillus darwinianus]EXX90732.1 serine/threonine protein kinase [Paenibacillus darwinianus]
MNMNKDMAADADMHVPRFYSLSPGELIDGRYEVGRRLGQGGMGSVYWAADRKLGGKPRALKLLRLRPEDRYAAEAEAGILMRLNHPRLPQLIDYIPAGPHRPDLLVTDFVEGENLSDYFERRGRRLPIPETIDICVQLCDALAYLHAQSPPVVHRDLKPSNVMIDRTGFVRLIDFGIARFVRAGTGSDTRLLGTPGFAAPEQAGEGGQSGPRSDIYGLGALLRHLLSGGAFPSETADNSAADLPVALPPALAEALFSMLQRDPARRPATAEDAARMLGIAAQGAGDASTSTSTATRRSHAGASSTGRNSALAVPKLIVVASFTPSAGGTFLAVTLAKLLERSGAAAALLEHPLLVPELFVLLGGYGPLVRQAAAGKGSVSANPIDARFAAWRDGGLLIQALHPGLRREENAELISRDNGLTPSAVLGCMEQQLGSAGGKKTERGFVIVDLSAGWMRPDAASWLIRSDLLLMAADPEPSKWTKDRMAGWHNIHAQREGAGLPSLWAANKDTAFKGRNDWLRMFPLKPEALVPLLSFGDWRSCLWRGRWATDHTGWRKSLERSLEPVFRRIFV